MTARKPFTIADAEVVIERLSAELEAEVRPAKQRLLRQRINKVRNTKIDLFASKLHESLPPTKFQKKIKI